MKFYKFILNGKTVGVSNLKMSNSDNVEEVEITEQEFNEYIESHDELVKEKISLTDWFDNYYATHEQKYRRLIALNKPDDDGVSASEKLTALYNEAEEKRARIQELEKFL